VTAAHLGWCNIMPQNPRIVDVLKGIRGTLRALQAQPILQLTFLSRFLLLL
jgi:hypothetical protein